ncbi:MAG: acetyl-CoA carboxylase biotin carboxyl carrier protein subunit [Gemmatimonadetes bacterium]|nr:acetyl-CoA carboxylase biotin carboxyl carrier protein subunit [Gemmatimonadota bacterium]
MKYTVTVGGREFEVEILGSEVRVNGARQEAELREVPGTPLAYLRTSRSAKTFVVTRDQDGWVVALGGERWPVTVLDERTRVARAAGDYRASREAHGVVRAPMPGMVLRLEVAVGDRIRQGAGLVVLEAMKMENEIRSPGAGVVRAILVEAGQAVEKGAPLMELAPQG